MKNDCKYRHKVIGLPAMCEYYQERVCIEFNGLDFYTDDAFECCDNECPIKHPQILDAKPYITMIDN